MIGTVYTLAYTEIQNIHMQVNGISLIQCAGKHTLGLTAGSFVTLKNKHTTS